MGPILVFGHKNPDNDSICSAVAYAHLKNITDPENIYVPARLGPVPRETRAVFERFSVAVPEEISHVRTRVRDVMTAEPVTVGEHEPMLAAGRVMRERGVRGVPVVDGDGRALGLVSERVLAERYLDEIESASLDDVPGPVGARVLSPVHEAGDLMDTDALTVGPETLLSEATEDLIASPHREAIVCDEEQHVVGMLTRTDLARGARRRVVLVDHNEAAHSAAGIEDASVVEIVDHHRVGDIQTSGPILFLNLPVGSTATIVATRYEQLGVEIPVAMAGILLGAVLTDTVLLKSPTTTDVDRAVVKRLAKLVDVEPGDFGMEVFRSRSEGEVFSAAAVVGTDAKEFRIGDMAALVAQYETVDITPVMEHAEGVRAEMERQLAVRGYAAVVLMVTDIVREGTEILAVGNTRVVERALGISLANGSAWMPGVLSRKKQVAARLVDAGS